MTSDSLNASASITTALADAPAQNGLYFVCKIHTYNSTYLIIHYTSPMPPPMKRRTGLLSLWSIGTITSVHCESSRDTSPIAFISSTNVEDPPSCCHDNMLQLLFWLIFCTQHLKFNSKKFQILRYYVNQVRGSSGKQSN